MTINDVLNIVIAIHNAENWNLGASSNRAYRNYFFARAIGCVYHGHPIYNATPDTNWLLKKTSSTATQSDDTCASVANQHFYDLIVGAGANGYSFSVNDLGVVTDQFTFAPPVPDPGVVDGNGSFGLNDFRYKVGYFTKIGTNSAQTVNFADQCGGFIPKVILFWGISDALTPGAQVNVRSFFGATTPSTGFAMSGAHTNLNNAAFKIQAATPYCIFINNDQSLSQTSHRATISAVADGSFTIFWNQNRNDVWDINYLVIGGEDVNIALGTFLNPTSLGNITINTPGTGQLTGLICIASPSTGPIAGIWGAGNLPTMGFGMVDGDGPHHYAASAMVRAFTSGSFREQRVTNVTSAQGTGNNQNEVLAAQLVSLNNNSFTLNFLKTYSGVAGLGCVFYIAIAGPRVSVGSLIQETSTGQHTTPLPFNPGALLVVSTQQIPSASPVGEHRWSFGATDGISQSNYWEQHRHGGGGITLCAERYHRDKIFTKAELDELNPTAPSVVKSQAAGLLDRNAFILNWTTVDNEFSQLFWLAFEAGIFFEDSCDGAAPLTLTCPTLDGVSGTAYSDFLVATGGVAPYTFSIVTGSLPTGLSLNSSTGEISGTPSVSGQFSFTARVTDFDGRTLDVPCEIDIGVCVVLSSNNDGVLSSNSDEVFGNGGCDGGGIVVTPFSGIYKLVPGKTSDTVYGSSGDPNDRVEVAIPTPFAETAFFPQER